MTKTARKLLIVEDDPGIQNQLRWCFEEYEVLLAGNRASATRSSTSCSGWPFVVAI